MNYYLLAEDKNGLPIFELPVPNDIQCDALRSFPDSDVINVLNSDEDGFEIGRLSLLRALRAISTAIDSDQEEKELGLRCTQVEVLLDDGKNLGPAKGLTGFTIGGCRAGINCLPNGTAEIATVNSNNEITKRVISGVKKFRCDDGAVVFLKTRGPEFLTSVGIGVAVDALERSGDSLIMMKLIEQ